MTIISPAYHQSLPSIFAAMKFGLEAMTITSENITRLLQQLIHGLREEKAAIKIHKAFRKYSWKLTIHESEAIDQNEVPQTEVDEPLTVSLRNRELIHELEDAPPLDQLACACIGADSDIDTSLPYAAALSSLTSPVIDIAKPFRLIYCDSKELWISDPEAFTLCQKTASRGALPLPKSMAFDESGERSIVVYFPFAILIWVGFSTDSIGPPWLDDDPPGLNVPHLYAGAHPQALLIIRAFLNFVCIMFDVRHERGVIPFEMGTQLLRTKWINLPNSSVQPLLILIEPLTLDNLFPMFIEEIPYGTCIPIFPLSDIHELAIIASLFSAFELHGVGPLALAWAVLPSKRLTFPAKEGYQALIVINHIGSVFQADFLCCEVFPCDIFKNFVCESTEKPCYDFVLNLSNFLSHTAIVGFLGGAAVTIALQQLKGLLGIQNFTKNNTIVFVMGSMWGSVHHGWNWETIVIGVSFLVFLLITKYLAKKYKKFLWVATITPMISIIVSTFCVYITRADKKGVSIVQHIKRGVNPSSTSEIFFSEKYLGLGVHIDVGAGLIALTEAVAIGRTLTAMKDYSLDGNKEMVAMGTMNIIGSLTSCFVATGSFSCVAVNYMAGCKTIVSNIVMSIVELLTLLLITPAELASIIIAAVISLVNMEGVVLLLKINKFDFVECLGAFFGGFDFTLTFLSLLNVESSSTEHSQFSSGNFSNMQSSINRMKNFTSWIVWGQNGGAFIFFSHSIDPALILFKHGQDGVVLHVVSMGLKIAIVKEDVPGESCVNRGFVSSRSLMYVRELSFSLWIPNAAYNPREVDDHANTLAAKIHIKLPYSLQALGVDIIICFGIMLGHKKVQIGSSNSIVSAKDIFYVMYIVLFVPTGINIDGVMFYGQHIVGVQPLAVLDTQPSEDPDLSKVLIQWARLFPEDGTWELATDIQASYPSFHLEDKVSFEGERDDMIQPVEAHTEDEEPEGELITPKGRWARRIKTKPEWMNDYHMV